MKLSLAFSPCPNDCFVFDAIVNRRIDLEGLEFTVHLGDVEELNASALSGRAEITKLSYHAYAFCADRYVVLESVLGGDGFSRPARNHFARVDTAGELMEPETKATELLLERRLNQAS